MKKQVELKVMKLRVPDSGWYVTNMHIWPNKVISGTLEINCSYGRHNTKAEAEATLAAYNAKQKERGQMKTIKVEINMPLPPAGLERWA